MIAYDKHCILTVNENNRVYINIQLYFVSSYDSTENQHLSIVIPDGDLAISTNFQKI